MDDMRQKLLPVFLEEAARKILQLDGFLAAGSGAGKSLADLEAAFRAAHTLKGTAALVQAGAVRTLSARIEGLLEGHFEQGRFPSEIEYEAMQLALACLKRLIDAVAKRADEPAGVLAEAELALRLAMAMPGRRRLAEVMGPDDSEDPFAEDPDLDVLAETDELSTATPPDEDLFADDPEIGNDPDFTTDHPLYAAVEIDPFTDDPEIEQIPVAVANCPAATEPAEMDPFADDPGLDTAFTEEILTPPETPAGDYIELNDPFADDPALEYVQEEIDGEFDGSRPARSSATHDQSLNDLGHPDLAAQGGEESGSLPKLDDSFIARMRRRIEKESPLQTAERLAKTLMTQNEDGTVARQYACCRFRVAAKDYYLPIENMIEISDLPYIVHLPLAPAVVKGLINLRGQVMPVVDLGMQSDGLAQSSASRKLVIAEAGGEKLAFLTDGIPDLSEDILGEKVDVMSFVEQFRAGAS